MPSERDRHLFGPGPKRALALDGGGTRGIVALAFLARIEAVLRERHGRGDDFRLCEYFDVIAGTSTGAIIAAGLALGMSAAELTAVYLDMAPIAFRPRRFRLPLLANKFDARPLTALLRRQFGDRTMDSADLRTGLLVMAKRFDTGSAWTLTNSPRAPYWQDQPAEQVIGNRHYPLVQVIRASTAAPYMFRPEPLRILHGQPAGLFLDGGVSPFNNPVLPLLMFTQLKPYGLQWPLGAEQLLMVSIGTGSFRHRPRSGKASRSAVGLAVDALAGMIGDGQALSLTLAQWLSEPALPWAVNSEIGTLAGETLGGRALFGFQRYDLTLEQAWLAAELDHRVDDAALHQLQRMDAPTEMPALRQLATRAAAKQVAAAHFPAAFDLPAPMAAAQRASGPVLVAPIP